MKMLEGGNEQVLAWSRTAPDGKMVVVACNFTAAPQNISLEALSGSAKQAKALAFSGGKDQKEIIDLSSLTLPAYGSIVAEVK
jgi:alpha-glucosidase